MSKKKDYRSLIDRFNHAEKVVNARGTDYYADRNNMKFELEILLSHEASDDLYSLPRKDIDALCEYKECFEWDATYEVVIGWEVKPSIAYQHIECASPLEVVEYIDGTKEVECPCLSDFRDDDLEHESYLTGRSTTFARVKVENLRPKKGKMLAAK